MAHREVAKSLTQAIKAGARLKELHLKKSQDLLCMNLMCEKVGSACICRLALCLSKVPNIEVLDLSDNELTELPDEIKNLLSLKHLDLSGNAFKKMPASVVSIRNGLQVLIADPHILVGMESKDDDTRSSNSTTARRKTQ